MNESTRQERGIFFLLRVCTILLAAASFWATAQGMTEYTFSEKWQAYAASFGIQGLLLGLNFALPSFMKKSKGVLAKLGLLALTSVVLFCSSWFSYLYIAGQAYGLSWDTDSQLEAQSIYREELFAADDFTEQYSDILVDNLAVQISELYDLSVDMDTDRVDVTANIDWSEERTVYTDEGFAARDIMQTVIDAMEQGIEEGASQDIRGQVTAILTSMNEVIQNEIDSLTDRISETEKRLAAADESVRNTQSALNNAPADVDITPYKEAADAAVRNYESCVSDQEELNDRYGDYQNALSRINYYSSLFNMTEEGVASYYIGEYLREIQEELYNSSPDSIKMHTAANEIFSRLQSAADMGTDAETALEYQRLLSQMIRFVQDLDNYQVVVDSGLDIRDLINQFVSGKILVINGPVQDIVYDQENDLTDETETPFDTAAQEENVVESADESGGSSSEETSEAISEAESTGSPETAAVEIENGELQEGNEEENLEIESPAAPSNEAPSAEEPMEELQDEQLNFVSQKEDDDWRTAWMVQFNILKAYISGLPAYTVLEGEESSTISLFDRAESTKRLDNAIRLYLTEHNAAEQGLFYLLSPYWEVAVFSLFLAFMIDIAAFITGVIIERISNSDSTYYGTNIPVIQEQFIQTRFRNGKAKMIQTSKRVGALNRYVFLTGDYIFKNDVVIYQAIEDGQKVKIEYSGEIQQAGLYRRGDGRILPLEPVELSYSGIVGEPQDGIYLKEKLIYNDGVLILSSSETGNKFLGNVGLDIPVYLVSKDRCEVISPEDIGCKQGERIVVSLNKEGTQIIAIYIEQ